MAAAQAVGVFLSLVAAIVFLAARCEHTVIKFDFLGIAGYAPSSERLDRLMVKLAEAYRTRIDKYAGGSATTTSSET